MTRHFVRSLCSFPELSKLEKFLTLSFPFVPVAKIATEFSTLNDVLSFFQGKVTNVLIYGIKPREVMEDCLLQMEKVDIERTISLVNLPSRTFRVFTLCIYAMMLFDVNFGDCYLLNYWNRTEPRVIRDGKSRGFTDSGCNSK